MCILITGAKGQIGKNLIAHLYNLGYNDVLEYDIDTQIDILDDYAKKCEFVFHLAGVNRSHDPSEFMKGNCDFLQNLLNLLKGYGNRAPVLFSSSIQAVLDNPYGKSKKAGEDILFRYSHETGIPVFIFRLPNVFGKWGRPNYNSVVTTFCHNIARNLPVQIDNPAKKLNLAYVDDVTAYMIHALEGRLNCRDGYCGIQPTYQVSLGEIFNILNSYKDSRENLYVPDVGQGFGKKLYSTYLSYLPEDSFDYPLRMHVDERGSFTEFLRTMERGQVSVNKLKPGVTKGNHWHHTKNEKFLVVQGEGEVLFRKIGTREIIRYSISGMNMKVVDIPPGYVHSIVNTGQCDLMLVIWANECFDPQVTDTFYQEVDLDD